MDNLNYIVDLLDFGEKIDFIKKRLFNPWTDQFPILFKKFSELDVAEAESVAFRMVDSLRFIQDPTDNFKKLRDIFREKCFPEFSKLQMLVDMYNFKMPESVELIFSLLPEFDDPKYKIEGLKFCYSQSDYRQATKPIILGVVDGDVETRVGYDMVFRWTRKDRTLKWHNLRSYFNAKPLFSPYDGGFVCELNSVFFENDDHEFLYRIFSAQNILNETDDPEKAGRVIETLLGMVPGCGRQEKSNILDIILRSPSSTLVQKHAARNALLSLSEEDRGGLVKTIYENSENVHLLNSQVVSFVKRNIGPWIPEKDLDFYISRASQWVNEIRPGSQDVLDVIGRIKKEVFYVSDEMVSIQDIFCWVVHAIDTAKTPDLLKQRMYEELSDQEQWCGSGLVARLLNIFSGTHDVLEEQPIVMTIEDEVQATVVNTMPKLIQELLNETEQEAVMEWITDLAYTDENKKVVDVFIEKAEKHLQKRLLIEYADSKNFCDLDIENIRKAVLSSVKRWVRGHA